MSTAGSSPETPPSPGSAGSPESPERVESPGSAPAGGVPNRATPGLRLQSLLLNAFFHACIPPLLIFSLLAFGVWAGKEDPNTPLTLAVFLVGAGGGVLSTYFRLKDVAPGRVSYNEILQIYMTPIIAGILGLVLYALFLTGLIQGQLFPKFKEFDLDYSRFADVFRIVPISNGDAAKALLWAFIAGFSEKLIPNILDQLADQIREDNRNGRKSDS